MTTLGRPDVDVANVMIPSTFGATPPPPTPPKRRNVAGGTTGLVPINPADDLRSKTIAPGSDPRLARTGKLADQAGQGLASFDFAPVNSGGSPFVQQASTLAQQAAQGALGSGFTGPTGVSFGQDTQGLRGQFTDALSGLRSAPDRSALAAQAFQLLREQTEPRFQQDLQGVGRRAAALGRVGAGLTTSELGDVTSNREKFLGQQQRGLALDAAGQTLADRINTANAIGSGFSNLAGVDTSAAQVGIQGGLAKSQSDLARAGLLGNLSNLSFGQGLSLDNAARGERQDQFNAARSRFGDLAGREGQLFGQGQSIRDEFRGERGFQSGQAQQGIDNAVRQRVLEDQLLNSDFGRRLSEANLFGNLGLGFDPSGTLSNQANIAQQGANNAFGVGGDLLGEAILGGTFGGKKPPAIPQGQTLLEDPVRFG